MALLVGENRKKVNTSSRNFKCSVVREALYFLILLFLLQSERKKCKLKIWLSSKHCVNKTEKSPNDVLNFGKCLVKLSTFPRMLNPRGPRLSRAWSAKCHSLVANNVCLRKNNCQYGNVWKIDCSTCSCHWMRSVVIDTSVRVAISDTTADCLINEVISINIDKKVKIFLVAGPLLDTEMIHPMSTGLIFTWFTKTITITMFLRSHVTNSPLV